MYIRILHIHIASYPAFSYWKRKKAGMAGYEANISRHSAYIELGPHLNEMLHTRALPDR